ncbi:MAG: hypothetical protein ABIT20_18780, partial [Gemmatimonadaceae bacterium]
MRRRALRIGAFALSATIAAFPSPATAQGGAEVIVSPNGSVRTVAEALRLVRAGGRVVITAG